MVLELCGPAVLEEVFPVWLEGKCGSFWVEVCWASSKLRVEVSPWPVVGVYVVVCTPEVLEVEPFAPEA
jgi:hypothetical protein